VVQVTYACYCFLRGMRRNVGASRPWPANRVVRMYDDGQGREAWRVELFLDQSAIDSVVLKGPLPDPPPYRFQ
jgi:hypothetical protein